MDDEALKREIEEKAQALGENWNAIAAFALSQRYQGRAEAGDLFKAKMQLASALARDPAVCAALAGAAMVGDDYRKRADAARKIAEGP